MFGKRRSFGLWFGVCWSAFVVGACAQSSSEGCHYQGWQGQCKLTDVRTTRTIERFPKSYVVVEAAYDPQMAEGRFSPPTFRKDVLAPAEDEQDATDYLRKYPTVPCSVLEPEGDPCAPKMIADIPEYVPPAVAPVAAGPVGCAKIESQDSSQIAPAPITLPGPFQFDENSANASDDVRNIVNQAASLVKADPKIECVAIRAKTSPGESFSLANERAQLIKNLMQSAGIDHTRLIVFEATAPSFTAAPEDQPPPQESRRVYITVVVYDKGASPAK